MRKSKNIILWIIGVIAVFWLLNTNFTPGTKTAVIIGIILYLFITKVVITIVDIKFKRLEDFIGLPEDLAEREENYKIPSYKLDIHIEPNWFNLYKKVSKTKSKKELYKEIETKRKKSEDTDSNLYGRRYYFTEYYDSITGLTARFQRILFESGKQVFYPVDKFSDGGYFFSSDGDINSLLNKDKKESERKKKLSLDIGEDFIRNDIFDKYIGGPRSDFDYKEENYLSQFPLHEIFNFLLALGQRFHGTERNTIIKWPNPIEKKFKELGIKYKTYFDYEPKQFDIEKHDKKFFEKWGKPKISLYGNSEDQDAYLTTEDGTYFGVELKIFRPGENDRITIKN